MKLSTAVATRVGNILREKQMSQYRLEKIIAMPHNTMKTLMGARNNSVNLKTIMQIIGGLEMTAAEFFDDPLFTRDDLEIDQFNNMMPKLRYKAYSNQNR